MSEWVRLGPVIKTQIHAAEVVHDSMYDADLICPVEALWLSRAGAVGITGSGAVLDFHHEDHPGLRKFRPGRQLSIGFSGHYEAMENKFGWAPLGIAAGRPSRAGDRSRAVRRPDGRDGVGATTPSSGRGCPAVCAVHEVPAARLRRRPRHGCRPPHVPSGRHPWLCALAQRPRSPFSGRARRRGVPPRLIRPRPARHDCRRAAASASILLPVLPRAQVFRFERSPLASNARSDRGLAVGIRRLR